MDSSARVLRVNGEQRWPGAAGRVQSNHRVPALCRASAGMTQHGLFVQTLEVFGYRRRTFAQVAVLESTLAAAIAAGRLTVSPSGLLTA